MEKNEHAIILDIPSGGRIGKFHSAILTTYAIDLIHFDNQLLNMFHRKQICSINVFADNNQMEKSMEYINPRYVNNVGKEYSITCMDTKGAFHPKIIFLIGDESVLVVFGTGNLTVSGHGKNHEAFTGFMIDETDKTQSPLIEECWQYITQFTTQCNAFDRNRILKEIPDNCTLLKSSYMVEPHKMHTINEGLQAALLYNSPDSGILQQIVDLVPLKEVKKITIASPFFDENGDSLITLSQLCPKAKVDVLIQKNCSLPPCKMPNNNQISFYDFSETKRGKMNFKKDYDRQLHAKIFHFKTSDSEYCLIGSANATIAGLGTKTQRGINEEFCVLYCSKDKDFLALLGLGTRKKLNFNVRDMNRLVVNENYDTKIKYRILSAQYENRRLVAICNETIPVGYRLVINDGTNVIIFNPSGYYEKGKFVLGVEIEKQEYYNSNLNYICYLINKDEERVSNLLFVNNIEMLGMTNPSKTSRSLNRFISRIENEGYEGMEVADMLSEIMWSLVIEREERIKSRYYKSPEDDKIIDNTLPNIEYKAEYDNDEAESRRSIQIDRTSRLIECIEDSIRNKIRTINNAILEEEEEGTAEVSNDRGIEERIDITIDKKRINTYADLSTSVLEKYKKLVNKRIEQVKRTNETSITNDDLNFFSLTIFAAIEICYLNRFRYKIDEVNSIIKSRYQKDLYDSLDSSITSSGLNAIESFVYFCKNTNILLPDDDNIKKIANRTMKYAILYGTLFFKLSDPFLKKVKGGRIIQAVKNLRSVLGTPTYDYLNSELTPLSERYDFVFRMSNIDTFLEKI